MKKIVFFCGLEVFYGSNTHYLLGDTQLFFFKKILQSIYHNPWKKGVDLSGDKMGIWPQNVFLDVPCFFISVFGVKCPFYDGWHSFFFFWFIFWTFLKEFQRKRDIMREKMGICLQTGGLWKSKLFLKNSFLHSEPSNLLWLRLALLGTLKKKSADYFRI